MHYQNERNYGCRVSDDWVYRGNKVAIIENELVKVIVLVDKGADIYSFVHKPSDTDYMWRSVWGIRDTRKFLATTGDSAWGDTYEGGWQTCAPTAGNHTNEYRGAPIGQHSEMSTMPWDCQILEDTPELCSIKFWVRSYRTPFFMEKTLTLRSNDSFLEIDFKLTNESTETEECVWLEHIVFGDPFLDENCRLDMPNPDIYNWGEDTQASRLKKDENGHWPYTPSSSGGDEDMRKVPPRSSKLEDLAMFHNFKDGWYSITNQKKGVGIAMLFDKEIFKYVWNWQVFGGGTGYPWYGRHYNLGLELCTSLPDGSGFPGKQSAKTAINIESGKSIETKLKAIAYKSHTGVKAVGSDGSIFEIGED